MRGMGRRNFGTLAERLERGSRTEGDCLVWQGKRTALGYGLIKRGNRWLRAHRVALQEAGLLPEGMNALHRCDNPPCVKLEHLYAGTAADNARDMVARSVKWKRPKGPEKPGAKVGPDDVRLIRQRWAGGEKQEALGREFGLTSAAISCIVTGRTWADVGGVMTREARKETRAGQLAGACEARLDVGQVLEIRRIREQEGMSYAALGRRFGVDEDTVGHVCKRETWKAV